MKGPSIEMAQVFAAVLRGVPTFVFARKGEGQVTAFGAWAGGSEMRFRQDMKGVLATVADIASGSAGS